jgi:hypothetical protein
MNAMHTSVFSLFLASHPGMLHLSIIIVQGEVLVMFKSSFKVVRNHSQALVHPTSTTPKAIGKIQLFGSIPTAMRRTPYIFCMTSIKT